MTSQYYTTIIQNKCYAKCNLCTNPRTEKNKTNMVFMLVQRPEGFIASNQTGKFTRMSNRGMQYICVFYIQDPNYIKGIQIKIRKKEELLRAYKEVYAYCESRGFRPQLHKMDNETSRDV